jgi:hypothetical protein
MGNRSLLINGAMAANNERKAYLLLGNLAGGSVDSSVFGLVRRTDILALVVAPGQR